MSFTDGEPRIAAPNDLDARWMCGLPGQYFRCAFCGYKFKLGDYWRFHFTNSTPGAGGNPLVCEVCDMDDRKALTEKWRAMVQEHEIRFWWFNRH